MDPWEIVKMVLQAIAISVVTTAPIAILLFYLFEK